MTYNEFLFYNLARCCEDHPLKHMEYDLAYKRIKDYYEIYYNSDYYNELIGEYECIIQYLDNYTESNNVIAGVDFSESIKKLWAL